MANFIQGALIGTLAMGTMLGAQTPPPPDSPRASTPEQLAHAKLHDRGFENKPKLTDGVYVFPSHGMPAPDESPDYATFLHDQVCGADLVVQGTMQSKLSMLNQSETWIFTDFTVQIGEVIYSKAPVSDARITVTALGGEVILNGKHIVVGSDGSPWLSPGRQNILLLESLSAGRDYAFRRQLSLVEDQSYDAKFTPRDRWSPREMFGRIAFNVALADIKRASAACRRAA